MIHHDFRKTPSRYKYAWNMITPSVRLTHLHAVFQQKKHGANRLVIRFTEEMNSNFAEHIVCRNFRQKSL